MKIILIVGPSGAGKDSLLKICRQAFYDCQDILFLPRYVTRMPDDNEQNYFVDQAGFNMLKNNGFFFIDWQAHGNSYGIILDPLMKKDRHAVIISVSRTVIDAFEKVFDDVSTIFITAPDDVLRDRLADRNRESGEARDSRLARANLQPEARNLFCFENAGMLEETAPKFIELMANILSLNIPGQAHEESDMPPETKGNALDCRET